MANIIEITDLSCPELDIFARLTEAQLRRQLEPERGVLIAEGLTVIRCGLDAGCAPRALLMERRHITGKARDLVARCGDVPLYTGDSALLAELTGFALTRGVLCAMERPRPRTVEEVCAGARRVVVLENLGDPGNVGAVFRSAAALGMDAVLVTPSCCDPLHRRAVRVSMGAVFQIPWAALERWPRPGLSWLRENGFQTAAMALDKSAISIAAPELAHAERLALILGNEGSGLLPETIAGCDSVVCIPMARGVDSLNVAAASAVAFWQLRTGQNEWTTQ